MHPLLFHRLTQHLQYGGRKFRHLVQKQNAAVCQRQKPGAGNPSASCHCLRRHGMMRRKKRPLFHQSFRLQFSGNAVDTGHLQFFLLRHRRQNVGNPFRNHGFSRPRRSCQHQMVKACRRHLCRPFYTFLSVHLGKILPAAFYLPRAFSFISRKTLLPFFLVSLKITKQLPHAPNSYRPNARNRRALPCIFRRHQKGIHSLLFQGNDNGQHTIDAPHLPIQGKLPQKGSMQKIRRMKNAHARQKPCCNRQIISCPLLPDICRRKIHSNFGYRKHHAFIF